ncbi:MAG: DUF4118 domain-containing protein [Campylobacterales bacterium]|nr:DUF4118 domain-containing protein [Campylobacterales bacterium]
MISNLISKKILFEVVVPFVMPFISLLFKKLFGDELFIWFWFYPILFFSAWLGGIRGAVISSIVSSAIIWWFFIHPTFSIYKDNISTYLSIFIFIVLGYFFGLLHENLKKANEKLRQKYNMSETILSHIIENIPDAIFAKDINGKYILFNKGAGIIVGKEPSDVIGKDDFFIFPQEIAQSLQENDKVIINAKVTKNYKEELTTLDLS